MKLAVQILAAIVALFLLYFALSAALGYLIGALVVGAFALTVGVVLKFWLFGHKETDGPDLSSVKRAEKKADKMLRQMERNAKSEPEK